MLVRGTTACSSAREGQWLADFGCFSDGHGQVALRDRNHRHPHIAADHDHTRAFVDNDLGWQIRLDLQLLDFGEEADDICRRLLRHRDDNRD